MAPPAKKRRNELVLDFSAKYRRINPSKDFLSEPMLNYMLKNASQKAYYKLIQISKYFFINEPPQMKENISYDDVACYNERWERIDPDPHKISEITGNRLWIHPLYFHWRGSALSMNNFLRRCVRVDVSIMQLQKQKLTYDELKFLMESGNMKSLDLDQCQITHSNDEEVAVEDILKMVPLIREFRYYPRESFNLSSRKVARLPNFYYLKSIDFHGIAEDFNCCAFRSLLKKAPNVTSGQFCFAVHLTGGPQKFGMNVLKKVNPTIEIDFVYNTVYFGFDDEMYDSDGST